MGTKNQRSVVPSPRGGWDVKAPGASRASAHAETKDAAIDRGREIVANSGGGELRIHNRDGKISDSETIPPGHDPNPPRDRK